MTMKTKKTLAAVAVVLLALCLVFIAPVGAGEAQIGTDEYSTLEDAFSAVNEMDRSVITIKLLSNVDLHERNYSGTQNNKNEALVLDQDKVLILDLNGFNLSVSGKRDGGSSKTLYAISNYGELTVKDSSEDRTGVVYSRGIQNFGVMSLVSGTIISCDTDGGAGIWNEGALTINGGTLKADYVGSQTDEGGPGCLNNGGTAVINGGKFISNSLRCYAIISSDTLTINNAAVEATGNHGCVGITGGTATIKDGTFTTEKYYALYSSGGSITVNGGTFVSPSTSGNALVYVTSSSVILNGGKFGTTDVKSNGNINVLSGGNVVISGGEFKNADSISSYIKEGYVCVSNGENYIVMEKPTNAVVPEVPGVTIPEENNVIEEVAGSTITPSKNDASVGEPITITISSDSAPSAGTYDIVVTNVAKDVNNDYVTTAESAVSVVQKEPVRSGDSGAKFTIAVDVADTNGALPVINPEIKEEVAEKISGEQTIHAMITAEEGNLEAVNDNIEHSKGKKVKITFTVPANLISNPNLLVAYHVKGDSVTKADLVGCNLLASDYEIVIEGPGFSSYVLVEEEPKQTTSSGSAVDTGAGNYQYYPRSVPADGIVDFGTSKVVTGMELPAGSDGTVTLNIKPTFDMPENGFYAFEIDAPGYNTDAKINGGLSFQIPVADLEAAGWTAEDIVLFHGTVAEDGKITWEALTTNLVKNENGVAYYKAAINSCSPFYIGFVKGGSVVNTEVVDPVTPETPVTPDEPEVLPPVDEPETPEQPTESPAPILAVLAGLGAAAVLRRK